MNVIEFGREQLQKLSAHFPKDHLFIAGGLTAALALVMVLPGGAEAPPTGEGSAKTRRIELAELTDQTLVAQAVVSRDPGVTETASDPSPPTISESDINLPDYDLSDYVVEPEPLADITDWRSVEVREGDNLSAIFSQVGLTDQDLFRVLNSSDEAKVLNRLYPGYALDFRIPDQGELEQLRLLKNPLEGFLFTKASTGYVVEPIKKQPQIRQQFKVGTVSDSLFMAGQRENIPAVHIMEMANVFGGVIDFILDTRAGDEFSILYEEKYLDGEYIGPGEILATQFVNQGRVFTAVRYIDDNGEVGYYNPEGESMRKAFLRNPLDVFRISSNFNLRRRHPILNTIRAHKGTDYAAPTGTPVRATSDGTVTWAARNGSFGNLIVVKHSGGFETKYAHLSRYAVKRGQRVRQGQVIGYVGATGGATGPHLHYEFLMGGVHKNPRTIHDSLPKAEAIDPSELDRFKTQTAGLLEHFSKLNSTLVLNLSQPEAD
jgi:murein DD-endopeptidase MepM/ murein hydrolase activator NlpD